MGKKQPKSRGIKRIQEELNCEADPIVIVQRALDKTKKCNAFLQRASVYRQSKIVTSSMEDAMNQIMQCKMYIAGHLGIKSMDYNEARGGNGKAEDWTGRRLDMLAIYKQWAKAQAKENPLGLEIVTIVVTQGISVCSASDINADNNSTACRQQSRRAFLKALNDYCIRAGWGDQLGERGES